MKTLIAMIALFVVTSCAITQETDVRCWKNRICEGDTYIYERTPRDGGGYHSASVQVITVNSTYVLIRHDNGREHWVRTAHLDRYSTPIKVKKVPGNKGRGRGPVNK